MDVLTLGPSESSRVVAFAAGAGGDPRRYRPLLERLADHGYRVIAPHFARLSSQSPPDEELVRRPREMAEALRRLAPEAAGVVAIGHSIGGWTMLCLAGAVPWTREGRALAVARESRIEKMVLYAPAAGWFGVAGALDAVSAPMRVYAGELDSVTQVDEVALLASAPGPVDLRIVPKAGHFGFMHEPPPGIVEDSSFDRESALERLATETVEFCDGRP